MQPLPDLRRILALLILAVGLAATASLVHTSAEIYEGIQHHNDVAVVDLPLLNALISTRTPGLERVVTFFTDLGGALWLPLIVAPIAAGLAWRRRSWTPVVLTAIAAAGSLIMTTVGKDLTGRARPPHELAVPPYEQSPSFPSGHTLNSTVLAGVICYLVLLQIRLTWQRILLAVCLAGCWAVGMGLSRVWLGHHWLTDVLAGWTMGLAWLAVVITSHQVWQQGRLRYAEAL